MKRLMTLNYSLEPSLGTVLVALVTRYIPLQVKILLQVLIEITTDLPKREVKKKKEIGKVFATESLQTQVFLHF